MFWLDKLLSLVGPHNCRGCGKTGGAYCGQCLGKIVISGEKSRLACYFCNKKITNRKNEREGVCNNCRYSQSLDGITWFSDYDNEHTKSLIESFKLGGVYEVGIIAAKSLTLVDSNMLDWADAIYVVGIPTANKRVRQRGWDQAKVVAKRYSKLKKLRYKNLLVRRSSFDQIGATRRERAKAAKSFFSARRNNLIKGSTIILIDDIVTTGATLNNAGRVLKDAGAKKVYALTFARKSFGAK